MLACTHIKGARRKRILTGAAGGVAMLVFASPALAGSAPSTVAGRYALADWYMSAKMKALVSDANMRARFTTDGSSVIYRKGPAGQRQVERLDLKSGQSTVLISEAALAEQVSHVIGHPVPGEALDLSDAAFDGTSGALTFTAVDRKWQLERGGKLTALPMSADVPAPEGSMSPNGRFRVVARNYNLVAIDVASGREVPLTTDGTREQPYGRGIAMLPDILKQGTEEPTMPVSVRWSPDGTKIMTWRLDTRGVQRLTMTQENVQGSLYPRSFSYIYPLAGAKVLPRADRLVIDVAAALKDGAAHVVPVQVPTEQILYPADLDMGWNPDGSGRVQWTQRGYGKLVVYHVDPANGAAREVAVEAVKPIVTVTSSMIMPTPQLHGELDISERSGWAQLYLVRPDKPTGGTALTTGQWEVTSVDRVSDDGRTILLSGVGREKDRNPYWMQFYRLATGNKAPVLLTPEPLDHEVTVSDNGEWFIDVMSSPTAPPRTVVRSTRDGKILAELGKADVSALMATGFTPPEPFKGVAADGKTPLYGMIYRPANFDPHKRYPVIDNVYTGPTTTDVPTTWAMANMMSVESVAQLGAIVVQIDGMGTSRRGQAFRLPAYQNLGEVGLDDHIGMIRQMAQACGCMDLDRVGVYGGSAGGYDAARFILRRPDFFKVSVASSGNHDLRLDKAWWPEVSMGLATDAQWEANSNMSVARNLKGHLLLIHGDIDDNVPVTESFHLANALLKAGRNVDMVILPNTTHAVYQPFFWRKFRDYFTQYLIGDMPPAQPLELDSAAASDDK
ncbi:S9 family peptidase [Novosphingobium sp. 9]|uniref:S9 family peptidase n=1 Tax=Novosphingobium sp. 9 TaxID=2025349 RepID=UPI0021B6A88A|nr:prolyl oligopeptidase family serine peptidase [Novosphingobium sp. 9]